MGIIKQFKDFIIITSGDVMILYNRQTKSDKEIKLPDLVIPPDLQAPQVDSLKNQSRNINSLDISKNEQFLAVSSENKQIVIFELPQFKVIKNFITPRVASKVTFTLNNHILVADKTGDVYLYRYDSEKNTPTLLLGHLSMILDVAMSECDKFIVTCDRDEKIRVSHFPNCYNIESYCLGHTEFVTKVKIVNEMILSTSGDGTVRIWNFSGEQLGIINTNGNLEKKDLLSDFSKEMDKEKVEISALPITDMHVYENDGMLFVAVSLFRFSGILLYKINLKDIKIDFIKTIQLNNEGFMFNLEKELLVLTKDSFKSYSLTNEDSKTIEFYEKYKEKLLVNFSLTDITVLYKKKFDNVQEYLERKKMRLQSK